MSDVMFSSYCLMKIDIYQWVFASVLLHAALTLMPVELWKYLEGGKLDRILHTKIKKEKLVNFLSKNYDYISRTDAIYYIFCHFLAVGSAILQVRYMYLHLNLHVVCELFYFYQRKFFVDLHFELFSCWRICI